VEDDKKLNAEYPTNDPWLAGFISECLDIYGCPRTYDDCLSREEEVWHMYSSMFLTGLIEKFDKEQTDIMKSVEVTEAAYRYAKMYEEYYEEPLVMPFGGKGEIHE
jgi:hypothetical protein